MQGSMARATSMTMMNARSSRSHAVFSVTLEQRRPAANSGPVDAAVDGVDSVGGADDGDGPDMSYLCAKMLMVDLAGSERVKRTGATGARLQEGIHINQGVHFCYILCAWSMSCAGALAFSDQQRWLDVSAGNACCKVVPKAMSRYNATPIHASQPRGSYAEGS